MSIENNLDSIARSLASIARTLDHLGVNDLPATIHEKETVKAEPIYEVKAEPEPVIVQPVTTLAVAIPIAPFKTTGEMTNYIMNSYKALGPTIGGQIQAVLTSIGAKNVNEVTPDKYNALFAGVEALKS